jgi:hypothetical protein
MSSKKLLVAFSCGIWAGLFYFFIFFVVVPLNARWLSSPKTICRFMMERISNGFRFSCREIGNHSALRLQQQIIEPVIVTGDGNEAYLRSGRRKIQTVRTGLLSRPQFLGCGAY